MPDPTSDAAGDATAPSSSLREIAGIFLRLGIFAFGGPAAHIAMMRQEVSRRKWMDDPEFMDLVGATNVIPGPNSTELAIHLGNRRGGWRGLLIAGVVFILPAAIAVGILAWAYQRWGTVPEVAWLLYGIKPVVIAIIVYAVYGLLKTGLRRRTLLAVTAIVMGLALLGFSELVLLFGAGGVVLLYRLGPRLGKRGAGAFVFAAPLVAGKLGLSAVAVPAGFSNLTLFLTFLKIGAVLYGSGYVLLSFVEADFVDRLEWLTEEQLIDAVAIGQVTPGPVFTTATFVGYVTGGWWAAILATLAIFIPSFIFVALLGKILPFVRRYDWAGATLDGINAAALGLMAAVPVTLARASFVDVTAVVIGGAALGLLIWDRFNIVWVIAAGGVAGIAWRGLT